MTNDEANAVEFVIDEFDECVKLAQCHVERAKILRERATAIAQLVGDLKPAAILFLTRFGLQLSDLLSYEEAVALKELSRESYKEGKVMHRLTVNGHMKDHKISTDMDTGEKYQGRSGS